MCYIPFILLRLCSSLSPGSLKMRESVPANLSMCCTTSTGALVSQWRALLA